MPRRCKNCSEVTPSHRVNFCSNCGIKFGIVADRPPRASIYSSGLRASSASGHARRLSTVDKTDKHRSLSRSSDRFSLRSVSKPSDLSESSSYCQYRRICEEYLSSLKWHESFFNPSHNRCYCSTCYPMSKKDTYVTGGLTYVVPRGWCRLGLQVDQVRADTDQIWSQWVVTYHGTSPIAAQSIVTHRQFLVPGDRCIDGSLIHIRPGHIKDKHEIYTSPTIAYSSDRCYCPSQKFYSSLTNKTYHVRIVLQCRQKPGAFTVQGETIRAGRRRICPIIPNDQVEIFTTIRAAIVPYGILIHVSEAHPESF